MGAGDGGKYPGQTEEAYPELFNIQAMPPQPIVKKPGQLTEDEVKQYFTEGFVLVKDFFRPEELEPVREAIKELVEDLAQRLYKGGKISRLYREHGMFQRLSLIEKEFPGANIILHKQGGYVHKAFRDLWSNERLLNAVEQFIGPDIAGHPVWNLRTKTPKNEATTVPWHQDSAYLDNRSYTVMQATAWIPLLDSNSNNGCMQMVRRGHKKGKVATHQCCYGGTWYVMLEEDEMEKTLDVNLKEDVVTCEVPFGGVLFFSNMIPHRSLNNLSQDIRWSLDLRWQNPAKEIGFYDIKEGVVMRRADDPHHVIDWESFCSVDRISRASEAVGHEEEEFDVTIHGPWMKKWELVHMNQHTANLTNEDQTSTSWHSKLVNP